MIRSVCLWKKDYGFQVGKPLLEHNSWVFSTHISSDLQCVLTASRDQTVRIWEFYSQQQLGGPLMFEYEVELVSVSDGALLGIWYIFRRQINLIYQFQQNYFSILKGCMLIWEKCSRLCCWSQNCHLQPAPEHSSNRATHLRQLHKLDINNECRLFPTRSVYSKPSKYILWHVNSKAASLIKKLISDRIKNNGSNMPQTSSLLLQWL